jgi:nucleotide-binding universal stress UspA family protein
MAYYYINDSLGPLFGSVAGWGNWLGLVFATAFYMIGFGSYLTILFPVPELFFLDPAQIGALIAAFVFIGVNYYGTKETGRLQIIIVVILVGVLALFTIVGLFHVDMNNIHPIAPPELGGWAAVLPAAGLIFVTYLGFAEINTVAEELKNPGKNLPRAVIGSLLFVIVLYGLVMFVLMGVEPYETIVTYGERAVALVAESILSWGGLILLTIGGLLAAVSAHTHSEIETPEIVIVNVLEVPRQTSLEQKIFFEEERVERQRELLQNARDAAKDLNVNIRTRAIVGRNAGRVILSVLNEENADQVLMGWRGTRSRREHIMGSTLDPILKFAPCEVTLVHLKKSDIGNVMALAGPGPHAPVAARRAYEFAKLSESVPTLLNVQLPSVEVGVIPEDTGRQAVQRVAKIAGLSSEAYKSDVIVANNVRKAIMESVDQYDTICTGISTTSAFQRILFGSLAEQIGREANGNVILIRGPFRHHRSIRQALAERLLRR